MPRRGRDRIGGRRQHRLDLRDRLPGLDRRRASTSTATPRKPTPSAGPAGASSSAAELAEKYGERFEPPASPVEKGRAWRDLLRQPVRDLVASDLPRAAPARTRILGFVPARPLSQVIDPGWAEALEPVSGQIALDGGLPPGESAAGRSYRRPGRTSSGPSPCRSIRSALDYRAGPVPDPGHAVRLCFSVALDVRLPPPSLVNIFKVQRRPGYPPPENGDLSPLVRPRVLLLNRSLSVQPGRPNAHQGKGWGG